MKNIRKILALSMAIAMGSTLYPQSYQSVKADVIEEREVNEKPNIIFLLVDDMGYTDTSLYGSEYYETPNLERLAEKGIQFTDSYAGSNLCSPSRATILTGRFPNRTGINRLCNPNDLAYETGENQTTLVNQNGYLVAPEPTFLPKDEITIPEMLKTAGYTSAHIGKWHLGDPTKGYGPLEQGYDVNIGGTHNGQPPSYFSPYRLSTLPDGKPGEYLTDRLTDEAVNFIKNNKDEPFFLNLAHYAVHTPLQAKEDMIEKYRNKPRSEYHHNATYAAMIESVDESLGRIMDTVEELGIDDNTIIVFTSDNGGIHYWDVSNNYPLREGKCYQYEGGIRIPTVISWPGVTEGNKVSDERIHHADYFPTFCELAGVEVPNDRVIDGESLVPVLTGEDGLKRETLYWYNPHFNPDSGTTVVPAAAIIDGDYKLIKHYANNQYSKGYLYELFNIKEDISESNNLIDSMPEMFKELEDKLNKYMIETDAVLPVKVNSESGSSQALKIPQSEMTARATSQETSSENTPASNAIDGNSSTIWHTNYSSGNQGVPQSITIDLGSTQKINKISYLPRQDNSSNGNITNYKVYVSDDGENFNHVTTGTWANNKIEKIAEFEAVEARYIKLRAMAATGNFVSASEINVYKVAEIESIIDSEVITLEGLNPMMPEKVQCNIKGGQVLETSVTWDEIVEEDFQGEGEFQVQGTVEGTDLKAKAIVKVEAEANPKDALVAKNDLLNGNEGSGFVEIENSSELDLNNEMTLEFKVMPEKYNERIQNLITRVDSEGNGFKVVLSPDKKLVFTSEGTIRPDNANIPWRMLESESEIPVNEWTDIRISFSSRLNRVRLYINDVLEVEKRVLAPISNNKSSIILGEDINTNNKLEGKLDSVKVYNAFLQKGLEDEDIEVNPDFNNNGKIDLGDLAIASKNYGSNKAEYDLNNDGLVDMYELNFIIEEIFK